MAPSQTRQAKSSPSSGTFPTKPLLRELFTQAEHSNWEKNTRHLRLVFSELAATKWLLPPSPLHPWAGGSPFLLKLLLSLSNGQWASRCSSRCTGMGESSLPAEGLWAQPWFQLRKTLGKRSEREKCLSQWAGRAMESFPHSKWGAIW